MFQVGRYDPNKRERPRAAEPKLSHTDNNDKKRPHDESKKHARGLRVIAPDESVNNKRQRQVDSLAKNHAPVLSEAIDDLDLLFVDGDDVRPDEDQDIITGHQLLSTTASELDSALKWSKRPLKEAATAFKMAPFLIEKLQAKYERFFAVQAWSILQVLWQFSALQQQLESDICITAPTGSGKTLAYGLPILHSLASRPRPKRQLRTLIVLPSRDLAQQVYQVFQDYCDTESNLRVGLAIGQSNFKAEQIALTVDVDAKEDMEMLRHRLQFEPGNLELALEIFRRPVEVKHSLLSSSKSNVDILVCTPGRLVDHLDRTPGFSLQYLEFLVVDEADRLLNQRYHNWMDRVFESVENHLQLRKFLVSATMTRDPRKLAPLRLVNPKHFDGHNNTLNTDLAEKDKMYSMPDSLQESTIECTAEQKPLVLLALLLEILPAETSKKRHLVIVFTSSVDSTHRLTRLLQLLWTTVGRSPSAVVEFSSAAKGPDRAKLLQHCNEDASIQVLVCSDGLSRGMDIKDVGTVIHYDVPSLAKTYVHRCGRTARAGQSGSAISLLKGQGQAGQFWNLRRKLVQGADRVVKNRSLQKHLVRNVPYQQCLSALKEVLQAEDDGEIRPHELLGEEYYPRSVGVARATPTAHQSEKSTSGSDVDSDSD
ncbi:ATP-dependent RNA helicase DDX51/DBP6 [Fistulifera solaris]|uniref:ATP-dependent RNA helicase n=1 Tax=Fistulifera solaris TaxID=1519565 RepID=A0A1Z5KBR3_FISSO|nr:ATP-dependent RNA helicase DDX51/DBP6 [Fistulifera solaris]|eukprot:GAX23733.1 ATP-dependent RNA helicase DDX51/DBP6 [Fistulifera solaris]